MWHYRAGWLVGRDRRMARVSSCQALPLGRIYAGDVYGVLILGVIVSPFSKSPNLDRTRQKILSATKIIYLHEIIPENFVIF